MPGVLALLGPTATGKTALAFALAERLPVDLISVDSAMVFRGMDIGTAKPTLEEQARYPHALVDIRDPAERYSAADFVADADRCVRRSLAADRLPVLVGGTMLYFRAFREGLADLPGADPALRAELAAEAETRGWPALHAELARVDPAAAAVIHPNNPQRLQRALEVWRLTGQPLSVHWGRHAGARERLGVPILELALMPASRADLHERIAARFDVMLSAGLVDEVAGLYRRGDLHDGLPSVRAVGYRQLWPHVAGQVALDHAREKAIVATRQLAKRQLTWLRGWRDQVIPLASETKPATLLQTVTDRIRRSLEFS